MNRPAHTHEALLINQIQGLVQYSSVGTYPLSQEVVQIHQTPIPSLRVGSGHETKQQVCKHRMIKTNHATIENCSNERSTITLTHALRFNKSTMFILIERKQKKKIIIISNLVCTPLESKQFQEVKFLPLIRCCVVIDQIAQLCTMKNSGYRSL